MSTPSGTVDTAYLAAAAELAREAKLLSHRMLELSPGATVLDVGCGPGTDTLPLAELVGPDGRVVGVDADPDMVAEARRRAEAGGLSGRVEHRAADAGALPFADDVFDGVRCERLFQHLEAPESALAEMARVARPGGRIVVVDTDWGSRSVDSSEVHAERTLARVLAERCVRNGYSGRRLYGLLRGAGLADVAVHAHPVVVTSYDLWRVLSRAEMAEAEAVRAGLLSANEVAALHADLSAREAGGAFFGVTTLVLASALKPSRTPSS